MKLTQIGSKVIYHVREEGLSALPRRAHYLACRLRTRAERREHTAARAQADAAYPRWLAQAQPGPEERRRQGETRFSHGLSFLIPTYNTAPHLLQELADALLAQTSPCWEACFYDGASTREDTRQALRDMARRDPRLRVELGRENLGIAGNTNAALAMARLDWVALVDHDDLLTPDAAYWVLRAAEDGADMVYSDEDKCTADGATFFDPHFKGDFAPDTLRAGNYICHLMAMERELMASLGGLRPDYDGSQDHDLALRASERARRIVHIPRVLYHWRMLDTSVSHQRAEKCAQAAARAVEDQLRRLGIPGHVVCRRLRTEISYDLRPGETVSLIARCGEKGTGRWLRALSRRTPEGVAEVLLAGGREECSFGGKPCRGLPREGAWARDLNAAARAATGDYLLFLVQGVMPLERGWLTQLRMYAQRPDVACVGSLLMTPEKIYLHGGYAVDVPGGALSHQGGVSFFNRPYMLTDRQVRNVTAVSASMLMIRRETFLALGGFGDYASDLAAASLGLRAQEAGLWNVFVPEAAAVWHGKEPPCLTGPAPAEDLARFREEFGEHPREKNYSPLLEKQRGWMILDTARPAGES